MAKKEWVWLNVGDAEVGKMCFLRNLPFDASEEQIREKLVGDMAVKSESVVNVQVVLDSARCRDIVKDVRCDCTARLRFVENVLGRGFLWHQVRCVVAVLIMVGKGQEEPEGMLQLLKCM